VNDVKKLCATCRHEHAWGILRHDQQGAPLYGPRRCEFVGREGCATVRCGCDRFAEANEGLDIYNKALTLTAKQTEALWEQTAFLNPQVPAATRMMVAKIMESGKNWRGKALMEKQWPEFVGLMISQLTDIRGAMVRDDSKFANLVAHTDEIIESMRGVVQLNERLGKMWEAIRDTHDRLDNLERGMLAIAEQLGVEIKEKPAPSEEPPDVTIYQSEPMDKETARQILRWQNGGGLKDEPVVTDAEPIEEK